MKSHETEYGKLIIGSKEELLDESLRLGLEQCEGVEGRKPIWALTGGSTPKGFYKRVVDSGALDLNRASRIVWTASDERDVPLDSEESNFGNADRMMLSPLGVGDGSKMPWRTDLDPASAVAAYEQSWKGLGTNGVAYDVCFVGMGDDCHTLSLFPDSLLLRAPLAFPFAAVDVPGKGWRLTLTPRGLESCGRVVLMTLGQGKASALKSVLQGEADLVSKPAQSLKEVADRAYWLVDDAAASELSL